MTRTILISLALFLLPFVLFSGYITVLRRVTSEAEARKILTRKSALWLPLAGVLCVIAGLGYITETTRSGPETDYVPAEINEDGDISPGYFE